MTLIMTISYKNKKTKEEILTKARNVDKLLFSIDIRKSLLIKGDNFLALANLLDNYANSIDLIYIDPPYNTKQNFTVSDERSNSISRLNNGFVAYSDNMSNEEYLEFIRERLILLRELLSDRGSIYLHIDVKMGHYLKVIMDEIFGSENFKNDIARIKTNPKNFSRKAFGNERDMVLFYSKNNKKNIFNDIKIPLENSEIDQNFSKVDEKGDKYNTIPVHAPGETKYGDTGKWWRGMFPPKGRHWRTNPDELDKLDNQGLIEWSSTGNPRIKKYAKDHTGKKIQDVWLFKDPLNPIYPTEKNMDMLELIIKQSSDENSIVLDCFAGSGSTLFAALKLNRRFIGIDKSDIAIKTMLYRLKNIAYFDFVDITDEKDPKRELEPKDFSFELTSL